MRSKPCQGSPKKSAIGILTLSAVYARLVPSDQENLFLGRGFHPFTRLIPMTLAIIALETPKHSPHVEFSNSNWIRPNITQ